MNKLLKSLLISSICVVGSNADYKLVLTDKDGVQIEQCIKSYSFSNNLESIAKREGIGKEEHSNEEFLTNKTWFGKPVYRRVFGPVVLTNSNNDVFTLPYDNSNYETLIGIRGMVQWNTSPTNYQWRPYALDAKGFKDIVLTRNHIVFNHWGTDYSGDTTSDYAGKKVYAIYEYTKTTDVANSASNEFKSYLHYVPSSSETEELVNVNLKNMGIQFLENYTYESSTNSCVKN